METPPPQRTILAHIFISPDEPRLRAGWRLLGQTVVLTLLLLVAIFPLAIIFFIFPALDDLSTYSFLAFIVITLSVFISRRWLDRRSFASLGLKWSRQAIKDLIVGAAIPALMMGCIFLAEWAFGWLQFEGFLWQQTSTMEILQKMTLAVVTFVLVGWYEELLSRGYHLQNLADGLNMPWAVALSSAIFGVSHLGNPNASWVAAVGILGAGYFLAYGYLRTRQLWLPIGLHIGWNLFEGPVFGFPVSGMETIKLLQHTETGPVLLTGGPFGPEAGLVLLPAMALGALIIYWYTRERNPGSP